MPREPVEATDSITFRLSRSVARELRARALRNHRSVSSEIAFIIEQALAATGAEQAA